MFATAIYFHPSITFASKTGAYQRVALMGLYSNGRFLAFPANIRLEWKWMAVTNTLAYYDTATITAVK